MTVATPAENFALFDKKSFHEQRNHECQRPTKRPSLFWGNYLSFNDNYKLLYYFELASLFEQNS